jgi:hypothetical protein
MLMSLLLRFHFDAHGPDETQELSAHGGDDLRFIAQAMSVAQLVAFRGFAGAYQVAECFVGSIGTHTGVRSPAR